MLVTGLLLGLLLGMRHALEPDHLAAVSNLVASRGRSLRAGAMLGACWGIGHSAALFIVGCLLAALDSNLPASVAADFELLVAVMLVVLGTRSVRRASRHGTRHGHDHQPHPGRWTPPQQSVAVGLVHGLAGSGALTALVLASLPTMTTRLVYILLFGLGSVAGMAVLTGIVGWPLSRIGTEGRLFRWLGMATGAFSIVFGIGWGVAVIRGFLKAS